MKIRRRKGLLYVAIIALLIFLTIMSGRSISPAFADTNFHTGVLYDLQKDSNFNAAAYPARDKDYSLNVIQIAEGTRGELFVYVYQPAANKKMLTATDINLSLNESVAGTALYELELLSNMGVFAKYRIKGLTVRANKSVRYYNITSISRAFDGEIDDKNKNDNNINKVSFRVGKIFTATTDNGEVVYYQKPTYTIEIIDPFVDYLICAPSHYSGGLWWWQTAKWSLFDSHFIAFSTDWDIDRLISADISYHYCSGTGYYETLFSFAVGSDVSYGEEYEDTLTVKADETFSHKDSIHGFTYNTYSWNKINSTSDFISQVSSSNAFSADRLTQLKKDLSGSEWVLSFVETERTQKDTNVVGVYKKYTTNFTKVSNVTILRLEFETDGIAYNLGAVSDTVSSTRYPEEGSYHWYDGIVNFFKRIKDFFVNLSWWQWLLLVVGIVLGVVLIVAIIKFGIIAIFKFLWWLVCLPFRGIAKLISERKEAAATKEPSPQKTKNSGNNRKK